MRWLARRDRTAREVAEYLARQGYTEAIVTDVLGRLRGEAYVDDQRLARQRAEHWCRRGYGRLRARAELLARGVEPSIITAALDTVFTNEHRRAQELLEQRFPSAHQDVRARARAYRFLCRRGFPEEVIMVILGEPC